MIFMQHQFTQITVLSKLTNLRITTLLVVYTVIYFAMQLSRYILALINQTNTETDIILFQLMRAYNCVEDLYLSPFLRRSVKNLTECS